MSQTLAIFVDQYRALKARKMFWIVLAISGLVVLAFGAIGIDDKGMTILGWSIGLEMLSTSHMTRAFFYKSLFSGLGIGFWLSWLAALLALISTGGIFPEFISSGAIDLTLSKPISRIRLFLTQYVAGLLFVTLQVGIFCCASFLVLGLRGGVWEPWLFLAVPLVVAFFSFLFSVCVLLGVWTRSTVAAILLTLLFWFLLYILNTADAGLLVFKASMEQEAARSDKQLRRVQEQIHQAEGGEDARTGGQEERRTGSSHPASQASLPPVVPSSRPASAASARRTSGPSESMDSLKAREGRLQQERDERLATAAALGKWNRVIYWIKTFLPKTSETVALLERAMVTKADMPDLPRASPDAPDRGAEDVTKELQGRSVAWVLGTSLAFEAVILALACFIFCRRDY
ncbi:MAG: ABC transporter permease [Phycisphaerae bacterium]